MKLRAADDRIYYPDALATCEPLTGDEYVVARPCLVVEVTSPRTRRVDGVEKLATYREIPSLQAYLIVEQGERRVDRHRRDADGAWRHEVVTDGAIALSCPEATLALDDVYRGVTLGGSATA